MTWQNRITGYGAEAPNQLLANPRNWRVHPTAQTDALAGVLGEVGWVQSVIVNARSGFVVDGHARIALALRTGQQTIPVAYVDLSEDEEALILATLDPLAAMAGTDAAKLDDLLRDVSTGDAATQQMLDDLATTAGIVPGVDEGDDEQPADIAEIGPTRCQPGDVWQVGRHTVACLDSTDRANVERLIAVRKVAMVWADPPYGIAFDASKERGGPFGGVRAGGKVIPSIARPDVIGDGSTDTARRALEIYLPMGGAQFWWGANNYADALPPSTCWIVWDKENTGDFADVELCWTNIDQAARIFRHMWNGMLKDSERGQRRVHATQKPIALCVWAFEKYGAAGDLIFDPFLGSGPSLKAAEQSGRTVVGYELSPHYVDHVLDWAEAEGLRVERVHP